MIDAKSRFLQPSRTKATDPGACGSSGSGDTCVELIQTNPLKKNGFVAEQKIHLTST